MHFEAFFNLMFVLLISLNLLTLPSEAGHQSHGTLAHSPLNLMRGILLMKVLEHQNQMHGTFHFTYNTYLVHSPYPIQNIQHLHDGSNGS